MLSSPTINDDFTHNNNNNNNNNPPETALHVLTLLLQCATFISSDNPSPAFSLLPHLHHLTSPFGSPADRLSAYFSHSLSSLLFSRFLSPPRTPPPPVMHLRQLHSALQLYNSLTPFVKFAHFTSNQAIYEAMNFDGCDHVHVIDVDVMQGLQWPGFFHILASRPRKVRSVKLTGFGPDMNLLNQTGTRLAEFADSVGVPFEFNPVKGRIGELDSSALSRLGLTRPGRLGATRASGEVMVVVHWVHHELYDVSGSDEGFLKVLGEVRPRLVTMVEQNLSKTVPFLPRFVEALHYYSALFDALGEGLGADSVERHMVEQQLFGREIKNVLCHDGDNEPKKRRIGQWAEELSRVGFESVSLSGSPAAQAGLLLGMFPWKGYTLTEENGCLRLGWKGLPLLTASAWQPKDDYNASTSSRSNIVRD